jgi:predicted dehydrogenase
MTGQIQIGFVAAGKRARTLMAHLYDIRDQEYFLCDRTDNWPDGFYDTYASETPAWVDDVSDLNPEITAIMNPGEESREKARALCEDHGDDPDLFASLDEFLASDRYDAVVVASPNDKHRKAVVPLLENDVDLLCEKPLAATLEDHDAMLAAEETSDALFYVGFQRRVAPYYRKIKELLDAGAIGDVGMMNHVEVRDPFQSSSGGFRFSKERSGGALLEKNSHDFDLFNWYAEAEPVRVTAFGGQHVFDTGTDIVDQATVNVQYDDGTIGALELCLYNGVGHADVYGVHTRKTSEYRGTDGVVLAPDKPDVLEVQRRGETETITVSDEGSHGGDVYQMRRFLRCLQGRDAPPATALEAKKAAAISLAAERSIERDGTVVEIDENYDLH